MKIVYDKSVDALYITLKKGKAAKTKEHHGYLIDYDKKGDLLGIEILSYSKKIPSLSKMITNGKLKKEVFA